MNNDEINRSVFGNDDDITRVLSALPHVDAPSDFDFGVKAKIARRQQSSVTGWFARMPAAMLYAVPLVMVLLLGTYTFFLLAESSSPEIQVASQPETPVSESTAQQPASAPAERTAAQERSVGSTEVVSAPKSATQVSSSQTNVRGVSGSAASRNTSHQRGGGSYDMSSGQPRPIYPHGSAPRNAFPQPVNPQSSAGLTVGDVLSPIGIKTVFENGEYRVTVVEDKSLAKKSGIATGDVVTAIDNHQLTQKSNFKGKIAADQLTVKRGVQTLKIKLQAN